MYRLALILSASAIAFAEATGPAGSGPAGPAGGAEGAPAAAQQGNPLFMILLMVGVFAFMWFVMIRPQRKEEKRRKEMIEQTKRGDRVVTIGGAHGTVEAVGEQTVDVRLGDESKGVVVTFNKTAVGQNLSGEAGAKDKK
ncbi:MAG: preprotein translocase subunit YajC [Planctomycetes bacterium]|nr:preprotein translocase subunit YajC [Planctomycetota bacterium]